MSVVAGIEKFKKAMLGHEEKYVLIGGGACSILFDDAGGNFRLTKDLDVVVLVDDADPSFGRAIWDFIKEGGYESSKRREGGCIYYRFDLPKKSPNKGIYPGEIELFSRRPDFVLEDEKAHIVPLPFDETVSSLSAIILDDGYYEFIRENAVQIEGVSLLSALHIIPLKMRAHIDNMHLYSEGIRISEKNLSKHRGGRQALAFRTDALRCRGVLRGLRGLHRACDEQEEEGRSRREDRLPSQSLPVKKGQMNNLPGRHSVGQWAEEPLCVIRMLSQWFTNIK